MRAAKQYTQIRTERDEAAMTFKEIAHRLGYRDPGNQGRKAVFMVYKSAMKKLRAQPAALAALHELSTLRQNVAGTREVIES